MGVLVMKQLSVPASLSVMLHDPSPLAAASADGAGGLGSLLKTFGSHDVPRQGHC